MRNYPVNILDHLEWSKKLPSSKKRETILKMDFSQLPYEIQFEYLLGLPYQSILNYCQSSTRTYKICKTQEFWEKKALQDFGISLDIMSEASPERQYTLLFNEYHRHPGRLIIPLIESRGDLTALPDLLKRSGLIRVTRRPIDGRPSVAAKPYADKVFLAVLNDGPEAVGIILDYLLGIERQYHVSLKSLIQDLYLYASAMNRSDLAAILAPYYDINRDPNLAARYFIAIKADEPELIEYLRPMVLDSISPQEEIVTAIESKNPRMIQYFRKMHPELFIDRRFINELAREFRENGQFYYLRILKKVAGDLIDK